MGQMAIFSLGTTVFVAFYQHFIVFFFFFWDPNRNSSGFFGKIWPLTKPGQTVFFDPDCWGLFDWSRTKELQMLKVCFFARLIDGFLFACFGGEGGVEVEAQFRRISEQARLVTLARQVFW